MFNNMMVIFRAEEAVQREIDTVSKMYDNYRLDLATSSIQMDQQLADNFGLKH
jgi:hypothetical protein